MFIGWSSLAFAFRPTDGTDGGVADRHVIEVAVAPLELETAGPALTGPAASVAVGLGGGWEVGLVADPGSVGAGAKRSLAAGPRGGGLALEVTGTAAAVSQLSSLLALTVPLGGGVRLHLDGGGTLDVTGAARAVGLSILEGPSLGPLVPVAQLGVSDGAGPRAINALAGLVVTVGPLALDAAAAVVTEGSRSTGLVRGGLTASFGPVVRRALDPVAEVDDEVP